jgi:hypothetical protein
VENSLHVKKNVESVGDALRMGRRQSGPQPSKS